MADLVIQGLHLPKSLGGEETHIDIRVFSDGTVIMATSRPPYYKKFNAIPIPEGHGDLIDRDALLNEGADISDGYDVGGFCEATEWGYSTKMIENAPTIVPSEGG